MSKIDFFCLPAINYFLAFISAYIISIVQLISKDFPGNDLKVLLRLFSVHFYGTIFGALAAFIYWGLMEHDIVKIGCNFDQVLASIVVGVSINGIANFSFLKGDKKDFGLQPIVDLFVKFLTPYIKSGYETKYDKKIKDVIHNACENEFKQLSKEELIDRLIKSVNREKMTALTKLAIKEAVSEYDDCFDIVAHFYDEFDLQPVLYLRDRIRIAKN